MVAGLSLGRPAAAPAALRRLGEAPNFALTTQLGDRIWLVHLRGRAVVLTFTCAACGACPGLLSGLRDASRSLGKAAGRRAFFAAVSVDPEHDSPLVLRRFAREQGLDPYAWVLLTGAPAEIDVVTRRYGVAVRRAAGKVTHDCVVVLIDPAGVIRGRYGAGDLGRLQSDLTKLLAEAPGA